MRVIFCIHACISFDVWLSPYVEADIYICVYVYNSRLSQEGLGMGGK